MLDIFIPENEVYNSEEEKIKQIKSTVLHMEHSLVSLYKWEAKFRKPFLESEKSPYEMLEYFKCMTINKNLDPVYFDLLTKNDIIAIDSYINDPMTATTITNAPRKPGQKESWTAELIYYYMIANGIPFECQKWHLNQLFMLMNVCSIKNSPQEKMSKEEIMRRNRELNEARKKKFNTKG